MVRPAVAAGLILAACGGDAAPLPPPVSRAWPVMGTMMSAAAWGADTAGLDRALDAVRDSVARIDSLLSTFRDDSEISRLNRDREGGVTAAFGAVLAEALAVAAASGGAFDPTQRDWRGVRLDTARRTVRLAPGLRLDFGGIAKGYALDRAALALRGVADSALLDLGGQFVWIGPATRRTVGIADPENSLRAVAAVEMLGGSVSTSSQAEQPGHIVDPRRNAAPAARARSVTVLAPSAMAADAWSTAFFVLGCDSALALAPRLARWTLSVVCVDTGGVRWTPDLDGRVFLPTSPDRTGEGEREEGDGQGEEREEAPARGRTARAPAPAPAPARARAGSGSRPRWRDPGS
ncbi:MAG: FAD:protein FMN transferase [Gemmatimonadales bacterium]